MYQSPLMQQRVERGRQLWERYIQLIGPNEYAEDERITALSDLIADVLHLADSCEGFDPDQLVERALFTYRGDFEDEYAFIAGRDDTRENECLDCDCSDPRSYEGAHDGCSIAAPHSHCDSAIFDPPIALNPQDDFNRFDSE